MVAGVLGWFWTVLRWSGRVLWQLERMSVLPWGAALYGYFSELILSLRPGGLMKGFFITFGMCRGGCGGHTRERRGVGRSGSK